MHRTRYFQLPGHCLSGYSCQQHFFFSPFTSLFLHGFYNILVQEIYKQRQEKGTVKEIKVVQDLFTMRAWVCNR